jgi:hypothetical protein
MNRRITALAIIVLAVLVSTVLLRKRNGHPEEPVIATHETAELQTPVDAVPAPAVHPPAIQPQAQAAEVPPVGKFVPGHFPGVSVSHEPGTQHPTPPEGTPRTTPKEQEIILPDGRRLIGVTLDETWRVPLRQKAEP